MRWIRRSIYRMGFRPKPGSIFFSPSIAFAEASTEAFSTMREAMRRSYGEERS